MSAEASIAESAFARQFEQVARSPDGIARLRELITTLAIQGKLVPQDQSEQRAADLLDAIAAEVDRQAANGRVKRAKPMPEIGDPCPFEVPDSWAWVPMGQVVEIVRGITFPASEKTREAMPGRIACLRTTNVQAEVEWGDLLFVDRKFVGREDQLLKPHDIVMSMANSRELVGKVALVDHIPHKEASFGGFLGVLRPWLVEPRYVMTLLRSPYARSSLIESSSQTTNIANISLGKLRPLPFPLPPLAEQARIVARVDELMRLCDALEAKGRLEAEQHARLLSTLLGTLTESRSAEELTANWQRIATHFDLLLDRPSAVDTLEETILHLAVRGLLTAQSTADEAAEELLKRLRRDRSAWLSQAAAQDPECATALRKLSTLPAPDRPFPIPANWTFACLMDCCRLLVDCHNKTAPYSTSGIPLIRTSNIRNGEFKLDDLRFVTQETYEFWSRRCPPAEGDIMFTREAPMGEAAIIPANVKYCLGQRTMLLRPMHEYVLKEYLLLALTEPHLLERAAPAAVGATVKHLRVGDVERLSIPLPPLAEQHRLMGRVTELRRLCSDLRQRLMAQQTTQTQLADALVASA